MIIDTWLLKSPNYNGLEPEILEVFPEARFVVANRSPLQTLSSMCRLVHCFRNAYGGAEPDNNYLVERNFGTMAAHLANRRSHPELPLLDLRFEEIVGDLPAVIEQVYKHADVTLTSAARRDMIEWNSRNAMHKLGEFKYSLQDAGLNEAIIRERMAGYFNLLDRLAKCEKSEG